MNTKTLPAHGTEARYKGSKTRPGCRCRTCITGWTRAGKRRQLAALQGQPSSTPSGPVTAHLAALYESGLSTAQIAAASGVSTSTILEHARGKLPTIHRSRATKILAVKPGQQTGIWRTSAVGTKRRIQALYTLGHGSTTIAAAAGMSSNGVAKILSEDQAVVSVHTQSAIANAYRKLSGTPGASPRARNRAAANGWHGPLAWDDIDDPAALPDVVDDDTTPRYLALAEDGEWLERTQGYTREHAAARLGVTRDNLQASITRARKKQHARHDLEPAA